MNWDHFRFLLAVARAGTLSGAARRLKVDQTTVARRLAAAEETLGYPVFNRADGRCHPTDRGVEILQRAADMEDTVETALRSGSAAGPRGTVRVTAVPWLINRVLIPELPAFGKACPEIALSLLPDSQNLSLARREVDIALRFARPETDSRALTRRVGRVAFVPCQSSQPKGESLPWISYDESARHLPQAAWIEEHAELSGGGLRVADIETAIAAVQAGLGRTLLPQGLAPGLKGISVTGPPVAEREIWMLVLDRSRARQAVSAVGDWLISVFRVGNFA
ncbi:MAG: LysR family transcriptional regulator [Alphaproteobacteria bacterium]|nr:LysR family transcriptional regulator [Alphaproteobacteria bacterium]